MQSTPLKAMELLNDIGFNNLRTDFWKVDIRVGKWICGIRKVYDKFRNMVFKPTTRVHPPPPQVAFEIVLSFMTMPYEFRGTL
ncbi:hypothetical protein GBA52_028907 [Prunus armeniaca]|nr:hypothetical protein GBA52_028907 [Prunus armeniaca]